MNYLTKLEKIVTLFICVIVALTCIKTLDALPNELIWVLPGSVVTMLFIIVLLIALNDERASRSNLNNYNELRKSIILEKINDQTNYDDLMQCNSVLNNELCSDCDHAHLHLKTEECGMHQCNHIGKVIGIISHEKWKRE